MCTKAVREMPMAWAACSWVSRRFSRASLSLLPKVIGSSDMMSSLSFVVGVETVILLVAFRTQRTVWVLSVHANRYTRA